MLHFNEEQQQQGEDEPKEETHQEIICKGNHFKVFTK